MTTIYRSAAGHDRIRTWCHAELERAAADFRCFTVPTGLGDTHVVATDDRRPAVLVVAGTNGNAATSIPLARALAAHWPTWVVDVPGQPGLSAPDRPARSALVRYGRWLAELLDRWAGGPVVLLGHSLGGGIALACTAPTVAARVLVAPAGLVRLRVTPAVLAATAPWLARPDERRSARLLRLMHSPGHTPAASRVRWMTLLARDCRTSLAPRPLPAGLLAAAARTPALVATGEHDVFLPPARLAPVTHGALGTDLRVLPGTGHLATDEQPDAVLALVDEAARRAGR